MKSLAQLRAVMVEMKKRGVKPGRGRLKKKMIVRRQWIAHATSAGAKLPGHMLQESPILSKLNAKRLKALTSKG